MKNRQILPVLMASAALFLAYPVAAQTDEELLVQTQEQLAVEETVMEDNSQAIQNMPNEDYDAMKAQAEELKEALKAQREEIKALAEEHREGIKAQTEGRKEAVEENHEEIKETVKEVVEEHKEVHQEKIDMNKAVVQKYRDELRKKEQQESVAQSSENEQLRMQKRYERKRDVRLRGERVKYHKEHRQSARSERKNEHGE